LRLPVGNSLKIGKNKIRAEMEGLKVLARGEKRPDASATQNRWEVKRETSSFIREKPLALVLGKGRRIEERKLGKREVGCIEH